MAIPVAVVAGWLGIVQGVVSLWERIFKRKKKTDPEPPIGV